MTLTLKYSAIDNQDIPIFLRAIKIDFTKVDIDEVIGKKNILELQDGDNIYFNRSVILQKLYCSSSANLDPSTFAPPPVEEWLSFANTTVRDTIRSGREFEEVIFSPLQSSLAGYTFIAHTSTPSIADWSLFSLLASRIKAMTLSSAAKYYRVVRWFLHLQHIYTSNYTEGMKNSDKETGVFSPASFELDKIIASIDGIDLGVKSVPPTKQDNKSSENNKASKKNNTAAVKNENVHPFARVDLRVGRIVEVEKHPSADRLYVEKVDFGEKELRTVVSGLVEHVPIEELKDRLCIFICNLKPASLCKVMSSAMLLVAKEESGNLEPLIPPTGAQPGDIVTIGDITPKPDEVIKPKDTTWEDVRKCLKVVEHQAMFENESLVVVGKGPIVSTKIANGIIS